jgi:transposase InsO family protein
MDITYLPMAKGFVYLAAVVGWHTRRVLSWRLSVTMDTHFCLAAVEDTIGKYGKPEIMNTDQGSQGEFNRSSQHWIVEQILETCPVLRRVFSSQVFFGG